MKAEIVRPADNDGTRFRLRLTFSNGKELDIWLLREKTFALLGIETKGENI
jgi:hypothetical protein